MKNSFIQNVVLKNRYTLLITVLLAYVVVIVLEGLVTGRQPDWLLFDNSLFRIDLRDIEELGEIDIDF